MSDDEVYTKGPYLTRKSLGTWPVYRSHPVNAPREVHRFRSREEAVAWIDAKVAKP